ncbi:MAG: alkyl sulfatase C-terminal domain-containing protein, partial [Vitreimonas sp.]
TPWGLEAEPIILELGKWAARSPHHDPTMPFSPVSLMLSFRAKFEPARAKGADGVIHFRFGAEDFEVAIKRGALVIKRGAPAHADATIESTPETIAGLIYADARLKELERAGALKITGARAAFTRFASVFEMPAKAGG